MWKFATAALVCALGSFAGDMATAYRPGDEVCTLSATNQCAADTIQPSARDSSVLIYPGGKTRCAYDDYTEASGRYSTNKTFFFQVFPTQQLPTPSTKLLIVFDGGGACIDADSCSFSLQCATGGGTFSPNADAMSSGVFNRSNPENLLRDWNIVHVPYCTGDLHVGNAVHAPVDSFYATLLGQPQCLGQNRTMHMAGYANSIAALQWARANYPTPEHLVIGGGSAGSLAVQALSSLVADMWHVQDAGIRYSVIGDSYVGVFPEATRSAGSVVDFYGSCDVDLKIPADVVAACKAKTMTVVQLMTALLKATPFSDWLFINSKGDSTQRLFYQLMKDGIAGYPFTNLIAADVWYKQAVAMIDTYRSVSARVQSFFTEGEKHVFTGYEGYAKVMGDSGETLGAFLSKWLQLQDDPTVAPTAAPVPTTAAPVPGPTTVKPTPTSTAMAGAGTGTSSSNNASTRTPLSVQVPTDESAAAAAATVVKKYVVGVCAMEKKTRSKPMQEILRRLSKKKQFDVYIFDDHTILDLPVDAWPVCDALISFYSTGFPLQKAEQYVKLTHPVLVNDLNMQHVLFDRRRVYAMLTRHGIPVPRHAVVNRDCGAAADDVEETDNYVVANGVRINKPFVEKPADAEDHNIYIYYPTSAGGGSKRLFRKVGDRSSEFYPDVNHIRRDGSYIYEEFLNTQGTDVKVYTVGSSYGHAEARKSPVLDGRVLRDSAGKEVRYPVILNSAEKEMARKVCLAFHQTVCGFDLLRVRGSSYVCDVNGWSFVKNSKKYYDDCGLILHNYLVSALRSRYFRQRRASSCASPTPQMCPQYATEPSAANLTYNEFGTRQSSGSDASESSVSSVTSAGLSALDADSDDKMKEELRCVIAIVRHGDRTPKQKLKTVVWESDLVAFYEARRPLDSSNVLEEVKVKAVADLQELLDLVRSLIKAYAPGVGSKDAVWEHEGGDSFEKLLQMKRVLERWKFAGINRKVQFKPRRSERTEILMILKWGGDLTETGKRQGEELGRSFRNLLYPVEEGGLLRLHSTFRHDLKIFTSDEGRVQMTAAAFAKGFLELEGDLTPILVSLVTTLGKDANKMLDHSGQADANEEIQRTKEKLKSLLQREYATHDELAAAVAPLGTASILRALETIKNPTESLARLHELIRKLKTEIQEIAQDKTADDKSPLYMGETFSLMFERWDKIYRDFYSPKTNQYDLSKIPDVHDCIKYDLLHNAHVRLRSGRELFALAEAFASCYVPQEYGMEVAEKQSIGIRVSQALCAKIRADIVAVMSSAASGEHSATSNSLYGGYQPFTVSSDESSSDSTLPLDASIEHHGYRLDPSYAKELRIKSPATQVRTRLYFTSESHMHTLLNVLRFQSATWRGRRLQQGAASECDISLEEEQFSNEILKRMGISVRERMPQRKYIFDAAKVLASGASAALDDVAELNYLAHVVIRVFETPALEEDSEDRFRVEIAFSPGVTRDVPDSNGSSSETDQPTVGDAIYLTRNMTGVMFEDMLAACVSSVQPPSSSA